MYKLYEMFQKHPYNISQPTVKMNEPEIHVSSWNKVQKNTLYCLRSHIYTMKT